MNALSAQTATLLIFASLLSAALIAAKREHAKLYRGDNYTATITETLEDYIASVDPLDVLRRQAFRAARVSALRKEG